MTATRWQDVQRVFELVVDGDAATRASLLTSHCGADTALRSAVEALLRSDAGTGDPLLAAVAQATESLVQERQDRLLGTRVGTYRIVAVLGRGGMSTVYRGERDDAQYQQSVAIKILSPALDSRQRNRLHSERQILATLNHPSIARLIDSGELDDGTPYLVMEHVAGVTIDAYCDTHSLPVAERLLLFIQVCSAVAYAHRNLIVHRDIKPANILVTDAGIPKLLDFGIAKLLAPDSHAHTLPMTRMQERILTPENAAPEQVLGRAVTTATDIYSLGSLLYRLLSGRAPYQLSGYSQIELERAICGRDPPRPSQAFVSRQSGNADENERIARSRGLSPPRLQAQLAGDLDAIVAYAMRKEPERRYASVEALADDLHRYVTGLPVRARQGNWRYDTGKFLRRHVLGVASVAAAFLVLTAIASVTLWQNHRIVLQRQATEQERDRATQVSAFLVDVFSKADPYTALGHDTTARELLDRGAADLSHDKKLQPEVRAQLMESIGLAYRRLDQHAEAISMFEQSVSIRRHERPFDAHRTAAALADLAQAMSDAGELVAAEGYLNQSLDLLRSADAVTSSEAGDVLLQYGHFELDAKSDADAAAQRFREAYDIYRQALGNRNPRIAEALSALAAAAIWQNNFAQAESYEREALSIFAATVAPDFPDRAAALATLGFVLTQRGQFAEAAQDLNESLGIERAVFGVESRQVAQIESHLGILYDHEGNLTRAIEATRSAVDIAKVRLGVQHYRTGYYSDNLAGLYLKAGDLPSAEVAARYALAVYAKALPAQHLYVASTRRLLGEILLQRGALSDGEAELRAALDIDASLTGDSWRTARAQAGLGWALILRDRAGEGEPLLVTARDRLLATVGPANPETIWATEHLGEYLRKHHRDAEADRILAGLGKG